MVAASLLATSGLSQAATCNLTLSPQNFLVLPAGGSGSLTVTVADQANCTWLVLGSASSSWVTVTSGGGSTGNGSIGFTIAANSGSAPRLATISVANTGNPAILYLVQIEQRGVGTPQDFADVPPSNANFDFVALFKALGETNGCGINPPTYCVDTPATRRNTAVFLIRAIMGGDNFSYTLTPYFADVPQTDPNFKHIQKLRDLHITNGCSAAPVLFCPDLPVTRGMAATLAMRAKFTEQVADQALGNSPTPYFADVPPGNAYFNFVQKMKDMGITQGCAPPNYCPDQQVTRGSIAVFVTRLFFAPYLPY
jgi:hypothetical protein